MTSFGVESKELSEVASFDDRLSGLKQSDFDEEMLAEARKILNGYDRDKSGFLEGDEIGRIRWKDLSPTESDLNGDGRISLLEMAQRVSDSSEKSREKDARRKDDRDQDRDRDRDRKDDRENRGRDRESRRDDGGRGEGVGGRGGDRGGRGGRGDRVIGRDRASSKTPASAGGSTKDRSSGSKTTASVSTKPTKASASKEKAYANYVENVFKKYDTDKDQKLSSAELKKMKRPFRGDSDGDGLLSKEEAIGFIKGGQKQTKTSSKSTPAKPSKSPAVSKANRTPSLPVTAAGLSKLMSGKTWLA